MRPLSVNPSSAKELLPLPSGLGTFKITWKGTAKNHEIRDVGVLLESKTRKHAPPRKSSRDACRDQNMVMYSVFEFHANACLRASISGLIPYSITIHCYFGSCTRHGTGCALILPLRIDRLGERDDELVRAQEAGDALDYDDLHRDNLPYLPGRRMPRDRAIGARGHRPSLRTHHPLGRVQAVLARTRDTRTRSRRVDFDIGTLMATSGLARSLSLRCMRVKKKALTTVHLLQSVIVAMPEDLKTVLLLPVLPTLFPAIRFPSRSLGGVIGAGPRAIGDSTNRDRQRLGRALGRHLFIVQVGRTLRPQRDLDLDSDLDSDASRRSSNPSAGHADD
ncbi:hypothetical protein EVG20_g10791 [Dentipellis fragilis]|uniref:Uncharacterized protein n=1 Tax=Dentipellis fragilis TaxID=205917 RepID=A0A4Y9XQ62_9AGAM|nr:hypothetical protein EVG20_g10791 [Dentipellis fragilis]